mgnify:CR=1 FL=1
MQVKRKNFIQLISEDSIKEKVNQIANEISDLYDNKVPILIGILNGSFIFVSDLARAISICLLYTSPSPRDQRGSGVGWWG